MKKWQCIICGFIYDEAEGWPEDGIAPGTRWEDVPADWMCPDCGVSKAEFEMLEIEADAEHDSDTSVAADAAQRDIVIVGSGLAGYTLAREVRKLDRDTPLTIVTGDDGRSYSKPMLSNAFAQGKDAFTLAFASAQQMARQLPARLITNSWISAIDTENRVVHLPSGPLPYAKLVLALGADPIRLPLDGDAAMDVLSVNDLTDYGTFRAAVEGKQRIAIMGAGLIGCEFANDLRQAGFSVDVIDPAPWPLGRLMPVPPAQALQKGLTALGVQWRLGTVVECVTRAEGEYALDLADGAQFRADAVLCAVGLRPRTELAEKAGLRIEHGIAVDRYLLSSKTDVYALGDCAQVEGLVLPYIMPIMCAARALAKTLCGEPTPVSYPAMPVVVKTPAHPVVISPPALDAAGEWQCESVGEGVRALFRGPDGHLLGFALTGETTGERQALTRELPALLA